LRFEMPTALRFFAQLDKTFGVQQRIGISLEPAGIPCKVDEQPAQYLFGIGPRWLLSNLGPPDLRKMPPLCFGEIPTGVGTIDVQKGTVIADRLSGFGAAADIVPNRRGCRRDRDNRLV